MSDILTEVRRAAALAEYIIAITTNGDIETAAHNLREYISDTKFAYKVISNIVAALRPLASDIDNLIQRIDNVLAALQLPSLDDTTPITDGMKYFDVAKRQRDIASIVEAYKAFAHTAIPDEWRAITIEVQADMLERLLDWRAIATNVDIVKGIIASVKLLTDEDIALLHEYDLSFLRGANG